MTSASSSSNTHAPAKKIVVTGGSGFVGRFVVSHLKKEGYEVVTLSHTRFPRQPHQWNPDRGVVRPAVFNGAYAVIHLAGENIMARPWTPKQKHYLLNNRTRALRTLGKAFALCEKKPELFLFASAVGYYGRQGDAGLRLMDESAPPGNNFSAQLCETIELVALQSIPADVRTVALRLGVVVHPAGGMLRRMLPAFKMGVGGAIGNGTQIISWVGMADLLRVFSFLLKTSAVEGAVNVCHPRPASNGEFSKALATSLGRKLFLPMPAFVVKLIWHNMGQELLLDGVSAIPKKLLQHGFKFRYTNINDALQHEMHNTKA